MEQDKLEVYMQRFRDLVAEHGLEGAREHVLNRCHDLMSLSPSTDADGRRTIFRCINLLSAVVLLDAKEREGSMEMTDVSVN